MKKFNTIWASRMHLFRGVIIVTISLCFFFISKAQSEDPIDRYKVLWESPSKGSDGSMPIGNGDIGLNVWVEEDGDLLFYIAKNDSWSENGRLLKLGLVRVQLSPTPFASGFPFKQELKLRQGEIAISAGKEGSEVPEIPTRKLKDGKTILAPAENLTVTPESRAKDIIFTNHLQPSKKLVISSGQ